MNITRTLTWVSRGLFAIAGLLAVCVVVYGVKEMGTTDPGERDARMRMFVLLFCSIAWCMFAGGAVRTLVTATSWPRALLEIASTIGFGLFFTAIVLLITGTSGVSPAVPIAVGGLVVTVIAKIAELAMFGAKDAEVRAEQVMAQVRGSIARSRADAAPMPPAAHLGHVGPPAGTFTPQPAETDRPSPGPHVGQGT